MCVCACVYVPPSLLPPSVNQGSGHEAIRACLMTLTHGVVAAGEAGRPGGSADAAGGTAPASRQHSAGHPAPSAPAPAGDKPSRVPRSSGSRGRKRRLRSRNAVVDDWLGESDSEGAEDTYADLERFIVPDDEEAT